MQRTKGSRGLSGAETEESKGWRGAGNEGEERTEGNRALRRVGD